MQNPDEYVKDAPSVSPEGEPLVRLPDGVTFRDAPIHIDARGSLRELFDPRWQWHPDPLLYVSCFTIRPGFIKGWGMHKRHEDRYFVLRGELEVVLYDERPESPTHGLVASVVLSEYRGRLMNIPTGIWHANHNIGHGEVVVINFPTMAYDHSNPDKYRLPLNTDRIPYKFPNPRGF